MPCFYGGRESTQILTQKRLDDRCLPPFNTATFPDLARMRRSGVLMRAIMMNDTEYCGATTLLIDEEAIDLLSPGHGSFPFDDDLLPSAAKRKPKEEEEDEDEEDEDETGTEEEETEEEDEDADDDDEEEFEDD